MCLFLKRIHEYLNINSLKNEESDKMSTDRAHIQGASGGESTKSLVVSGSHSLTFDAEYVFLFFKHHHYLQYYIINDYLLLLVLQEFL